MHTTDKNHCLLKKAYKKTKYAAKINLEWYLRNFNMDPTDGGFVLLMMFAVNIVILAVADELYNNKQAKIGQVISIIVLPISKDISYLCYNFIWPVWSILVVFILSKAKEHYRYR